MTVYICKLSVLLFVYQNCESSELLWTWKKKNNKEKVRFKTEMFDYDKVK